MDQQLMRQQHHFHVMHTQHAQMEARHKRELQERAAKGDRLAQRQLRKMNTGEGARVLTTLGVIVGGIALGAASTVVAPAAFGAGLVAKTIAQICQD